jgi:hypothetical protein
LRRKAWHDKRRNRRHVGETLIGAACIGIAVEGRAAQPHPLYQVLFAIHQGASDRPSG